MKILRLEFKNINSIAGTCTIDFEAMGRENNGLFLIFGPTGSGKTTILDAICLALYGETPRIKSVSGQDNISPVISTGFWDATAQVDFRADDGKVYRAFWQQLHQKSQQTKGRGGLKVFRVLYRRNDDGETWHALSDKINTIGKHISELTGMNFGRFTRITLLAQGEFQKFLTCEDDERAEILEKLTGTELFTFISKAVYEKKKELDLQYGEFTRRRADLEQRSGTAEEHRQVSENQTAAAASLEEFKQKLKKLQSESDWLAEDAKCRAAEAAVATETDQFDAEKRPVLTRARQAAELLVQYNDLRRLRTEDAKEREELARLNDDSKQKAQKVDAARKASTEAEDALKAAQTAAEQLRNLLTEVEKLDIRIDGDNGLRAQAAGAQEAADRAAEELRLHTSKQQENRDKQRRTSAELDALGTAQNTAACTRDGDISAALGAIRTGLGEWSTQDKNAAAKEHELSKLASAAELASQQAACDKKASAVRTELAGTRKALLALALDDAGVALLRERRADIASWQGLLPKLAEAQKKSLEYANMSAALESQLEQNRQAAADAERKLSDAKLDCEKQRAILAELQRAMTYDEARKSLTEGEACPLCGAVHHPWANQNFATDAAKENCTRAEAAQAEADRACRLAQKAFSDTEKALALANNDLRRGEQECRDSRNSIAEYARKTDLPEASEGTALEAVSSEIASRIELFDRLSKESSRLEKAVSDAGQAVEKASAALENRGKIEAERDAFANAAGESRDRLLKDLKPFFTELDASITPQRFKTTLLADLEARDNAWRQRDTQIDALKRDLTAFKTAAGELANELPAKEAAAKNASAALSAVRNDLNALLAERHALCGERDVQREFREADEKKAACNRICQDSAAALTQATNALNLSAGNIEQLRKQLDSTADALKNAESSFPALLATHNFAGEAAFVLSLLPSDKLKELEAEEQELRDKKTAAAAERQRLESRRPAEFTPELPAAIQQTTEEIAARQSVIEQCNFQQSMWRQAQQELEKLLAQHDADAVNLKNWQRLCELIGQQDGKRFRVIAQSYTLDFVLQQANRRICTLMQDNRYRLIRENREASMGLAIIDRTLNDAVRTVDNLSGGEKFMVSLALALALSDLNAGNRSIQTLFLDEGFGTLDEQRLNEVITALENLNSEGRQIGIISHVEDLREVIPLQIELKQNGDGFSTVAAVNGAGWCRHDLRATAKTAAKAKKDKTAKADPDK